MITAQHKNIDTVTIAVMANRLDAIVREMSNTLQRAGRSAVINVARDFSCSIVTGDNQLLSVAEGLPVHVFGSHLQTASIHEFHNDISEGDAFLHNDPYFGNTHPADHTIIVPIFAEGELLFMACAKAHQADIGNSIPTTYHARARDVYEEGSLTFPGVRIQKNFENINDIIRMCKRRIRVPEQWYGDYLAGLGAARIGERRLKEFIDKYGINNVKEFVTEWLDYSERRMVDALQKLPKGRLTNEVTHDPMEGILDHGIPVKVTVDVDPGSSVITVDMTDNPDCVDCGLNQSEACAINNVVTGVFNCLDWDVPHNSGSMRRLNIILRDNCVVGRPKFPHSCSMATTNLADRIINVTQSAFAELGEGFGLAQGGNAIGAGQAVVSGNDWRRENAPYINQLFLSTNGGPGSAEADGWVTYALPCCSGLLYRDSIELDEIKHPIHVESVRLMKDGGGAGRRRGAPGTEVIFGPKKDLMTAVIPSDGHLNPPAGVRGGKNGNAARTFKIEKNGNETRLPNVANVELMEGELIKGIDSGGGGYGDPLDREPSRVLEDILEQWISQNAAKSIYGVILTGKEDNDTLAVNEIKTELLRAKLRVERI